MQPRVGVGVFVFRNGKFLIGRRVGAHATDTWSIPGGWLEYRESTEDACIREVFEETGMNISNLRFRGVSNNIFKNEEIHSVTIWMMSDWQEDEAQVMEPEKVVDYRWIDFDSLPVPLFPAWDHLLKSEFMPALHDAIESSRIR